MRAVAALIILAALAEPAAAEILRPARNDIEEIRTTQFYLAYPEGQVEAFEQELRQTIGKQSGDAAADALATRYGFPAADMRRFVAAWIIAHSRRFNNKSWVGPVSAELEAVTPHLRNTTLGVAMLAEALDVTSDDCPRRNFDVLMQGSTTPATDGYAIATTAGCPGNFARAAVAAGDRNMPALIRMAQWGGLPPRDLLPLYAWLTSPAALAHIREPDRLALSTILWRRYFTALFDADLSAKALTLFDALPANLRLTVIDPSPRPKVVAEVDDIVMTFKAESEGGSSEDLASDLLADAADALESQADALAPKTAKPSAMPASTKPPHRDAELRDYSAIEAPILPLAEAMALGGREEEARKLLATVPGLGQAQAALACEYSRSNEKTECPDSRRLPMGALPLDHLLNRPSEDPYPLAEVTLSGSGPMGESASGAILCRLFPEAEYPGLCPVTGEDGYFARSTTEPKQVAEVETALARVIPDFDSLRATIIGLHDAPAKPHESWSRRAAVVAVPPGYEEAAIPADAHGNSVPVVELTVAALSHFASIRFCVRLTEHH